MSDHCPVVLIGIGSPHGDDQFGWVVVDRVCSMGLTAVEFCKLHNPVDLIAELESHQRVDLVDAGAELPGNADFLRLVFADQAHRKLIQEIEPRSSHDIGVYQSLRTAEALGKRTDHVILWIGHGNRFEPLSEMTCATARAARNCATTLIQDLT